MFKYFAIQWLLKHRKLIPETDKHFHSVRRTGFQQSECPAGSLPPSHVSPGPTRPWQAQLHHPDLPFLPLTQGCPNLAALHRPRWATRSGTLSLSLISLLSFLPSSPSLDIMVLCNDLFLTNDLNYLPTASGGGCGNCKDWMSQYVQST